MDPSTLIVLGSGRSGTTLVLRIISCLDDVIAVPRLAGRFPKLSRLATLLTRWGIGPNAWRTPSGESTGLFAEVGISQEVHAALGRVMGPEDLTEQGKKTLRKRLEVIRRVGGCPVVATKNTAATGRVPLLIHAFPDAAFLHVVRDPREVIMSLLRTSFWKEMTLWWDGRTTSQFGKDEGITQEEVAAIHWTKQVSAARDGLSILAPDRTAIVSYSDIVASPIITMANTLTSLKIPIASREAWERRLKKLNIHRRSTNRSFPKNVTDAVAKHAETLAVDLGFLS